MKTYIKILLILGLMMSVAPTGANALTFYLDNANINNTGTAGPWASVTLTDSTYLGNSSVHFVVDPIDSAFVNRGTNFGLQDFSFNENTSFGSLLNVANFNFAGWSYKYGSNNAGGGFGKFDFSASGTGSNRANPLSFDVFAQNGALVSIANFSSTLSSTGFLFAAHIADYNGGNSAQFATDGSTPVPEPGTMMLLGFGMLSIAIYGKRRMHREQEA